MGLTSHQKHSVHFTQDSNLEYRCPATSHAVFTISHFFAITHELKEVKGLSFLILHLVCSISRNPGELYWISKTYLDYDFVRYHGRCLWIEDVPAELWASLHHYLLTTTLVEPRVQLLRRFEPI